MKLLVALSLCSALIVLTPTAAYAVATTRRISVSTSGAQADVGATDPAMSATGVPNGV
jgi:hypothetical protein